MLNNLIKTKIQFRLRFPPSEIPPLLQKNTESFLFLLYNEYEKEETFCCFKRTNFIIAITHFAEKEGV